MRENTDGVVLNDGMINYLGGRNFIASSRTPAFDVSIGDNYPMADLAMADITVLPYDDPSELK